MLTQKITRYFRQRKIASQWSTGTPTEYIARESLQPPRSPYRCRRCGETYGDWRYYYTGPFPLPHDGPKFEFGIMRLRYGGEEQYVCAPYATGARTHICEDLK
jgi:hypothetical protein